MAIQYNVNLIGSLTNTNGVLSGFSTNSNYATFSSDTFNDTDVEIVFKTKFNRVTGDDQIYYAFYDSTKTYSLCVIGLSGGKFYFEITNGLASLGYISGTTTVVINTDYYIKAVRNNTTYTLYSSTNGTNWATEGTLSNITFPSYTSATNYIGGYVYDDNGLAIDQILDGTVNLNESYIKVGGQYVWRGVTNITQIQLRHDTATNWTSVNPVLLEGEVGIETDTLKQKVGDGVTAWNSLSYMGGSEIYLAEYGVTTYSEITTALANYKTVICKDGNRLYYYIRAVGGYTFGSSFGANAEYVFVDSNSTWSRGSIFLANRDLSNVTSINSGSAVQTALDEKADTNLSNLSSTGKEVIDGQWIALGQDVIATAVSVNGSTDLPYTVNVPNDGHVYEVMIRADANTNATSGNWFIISIKTNSTLTGDYAFICGAKTTSNSTVGSMGTVIVPIKYATNNLYLRRNTNYHGSTMLKALAYRRVGTNA